MPVASSFTIRRLLLRGREYHSERCGQHARLFLREGAEAKQWQDRRILYFRAENLDISGEIFAKCTFRQRFFFGSKRTKYAYFAKIGCPGVHFSEILPESCSLAALGYIWRRFRHVSAFRPGIAHWGKPCLALSDMFPRSAQGSPVVWGLRDCPCIGPRYRLSHSARNRSWHRPPGGVACRIREEAQRVRNLGGLFGIIDRENTRKGDWYEALYRCN